ncbi:MAG: heme-binding domain-containing protein [Candidatus Lambdaproteobacteria bacterium]|nr:heme-binding domain-containing protein [Candidatus Lambdaproteobacteria bacterium]
MQSRFKQVLRYAAIVIVVVLVLLWGVGELTRPASSAEPVGAVLNTPSDTLLSRACFDCHSNQTRWPWYAHLPVVGVMLNQSVREGRDELNFSDWAAMNAGRQAKKLKESREKVMEGDMPPWDYLLLHPEARLGPAEQAQLSQDLAAALGGGALSSAGGQSGFAGQYGKGDDDDDD